MLLIQKAKADELDDARDVFAHARPAATPAPAESIVYGDDDEADLDEDDEYDFNCDDYGEEAYDEDDDFDPGYDPKDDQDDEQDDYNNSSFGMKLT
ncbi:MAG: hypothetical protein IKX19_00785 [Clostridia bacterium]|nr:hypothetical protein [Clostridia bacterium]